MYRPSFSLESMPRRAIRGVICPPSSKPGGIEGSRNPCRHAALLFGRLRARPREGLRIGEMASTTSSKSFESWTLAAEWIAESGMPPRSTTTRGASSPPSPYPSDSGRSFGPPGAATPAESKEARSQSVWSASPKRSKSPRCSRSHTPASFHPSRRRQQVIPEPQPISLGAASPRGCRS